MVDIILDYGYDIDGIQIATGGLSLNIEGLTSLGYTIRAENPTSFGIPEGEQDAIIPAYITETKWAGEVINSVDPPTTVTEEALTIVDTWIEFMRDKVIPDTNFRIVFDYSSTETGDSFSKTNNTAHQSETSHNRVWIGKIRDFTANVKQGDMRTKIQVQFTFIEDNFE